LEKAPNPAIDRTQSQSPQDKMQNGFLFCVLSKMKLAKPVNSMAWRKDGCGDKACREGLAYPSAAKDTEKGPR
jgi:hypothetical protein